MQVISDPLPSLPGELVLLAVQQPFAAAMPLRCATPQKATYPRVGIDRLKNSADATTSYNQSIFQFLEQNDVSNTTLDY